jgi:hypothetical protein
MGILLQVTLNFRVGLTEIVLFRADPVERKREIHDGEASFEEVGQILALSGKADQGTGEFPIYK